MDRRAFLRRAGLVTGGVVAGAGGGLAHEWEHIHYDLAASGHAVGEQRPPNLTQTRLIYRVPGADTGSPRMAFTFDDGPSTAYTERMLAVLDRADIRATFFQVGARVRQLPELSRAVAARHVIGNHTWDHPDLGLAQAGEAHAQLARTHEQIATTTGTAPTLFRPPFGRFSGATAMIATSLGYPIVLWDTLFDVTASAKDNIEKLAASAQDGTIILGHDGGPLDSDVVIDALPELIERLRDRGFAFQTIPQLLGTTPS